MLNLFAKTFEIETKKFIQVFAHFYRIKNYSVHNVICIAIYSVELSANLEALCLSVNDPNFMIIHFILQKLCLF